MISIDRFKIALVAAALLSALPVGGCSTSIADLPLIGTPADAPSRPKEVGAYPAVHDLPQDRPEAAMDATERNKVSSELIAARDRQAAIAAAEAAAAAAAKNPAAK
ncbi:MAG: hypothetical protein QOJ86_2615 [Bradyrhizobium sp.]|nr:hypothetical protein [Bradyrhizobium sp.]